MPRTRHSAVTGVVASLPKAGLVLAFWASSLGCNSGAPENSYANVHATEIQLDCNKTVMCRAQQGMTLEDNPIPSCVERTGNELNAASDENRAVYERRVANCGHLLPCDYLNCLQQTTTSFAEAHITEITHDCNSLVACEAQRGIASGMDAFNNCAASERRRLDMLDASSKTDYEVRFMMCSGLIDCSFVDCFRALTP